MRESADCSTRHQRYHVLSAATLSNGGNRNFVHMKVMVGAGVSCIRGSRKPFAVAVSSRTLFKGSALKMRIPPIVPTKRNRRWMATGNGTASSALAPSKRWGQRAPAPASAYRKSSRCFMMPRAKFITNTSQPLTDRWLKRPKIDLELLDRSCLDGSVSAWAGNGLKTR